MSVIYCSTSRQKLFDALYIAILLFYTLSGMMLVPFHGDEATTIYLSRDWFRIIQDHDLSLILYRPIIDDPREHDLQEYRLQNGVISKYTIGMMASLIGLRFEDVNDPWYWGADFEDNRAHGHIPKPAMFLAARLSSTLMLMISIAVAFSVGKILGNALELSSGHSCALAYVTTFIYATLPAVLMNGRRAMYEGANLLAMALIIWTGLLVAQKIKQKQIASSKWLVFGIACGFGVASKHTVLLTIGVVFVAFLLIAVVQARQILGKVIVGLILSSCIMLAIFLALNPAWWNQPLQMPALIAQIRQNTLTAQLKYMGGYINALDRLVAPLHFPFSQAQYFEGEHSAWSSYIGSEINVYSSSGLAGINWESLGFLTYPLLLISILALTVLIARQHYIAILPLALASLTALALLILIPVPWQRYYLPLELPWSMLMAFGILSICSFWRHKSISSLFKTHTDAA